LRKKMFLRMMAVLASVTLIIQLLMNTGLLKIIEQAIQPMATFFNLPPVVLGPVSAYVFSPTVGITYMSNLLGSGLVSQFHAIVALLAGGLLMIPVMRLRRTLPRYMSIYGPKNGAAICAITAVLSMFSRIIILILVLIFF